MRLYQRKLYSSCNRPATILEDRYQWPVGDQRLNQIHCFDSRILHELLPENSIDLVVTSPPYNVGMGYDADLSLEDYLEDMREAIRGLTRVLVPGGRICWNVANVGRKPYIPLTMYFHQIFIDQGLLCRGEIIWNKQQIHGNCAWGSWRTASNPVLRDQHEYILIYSKGSYKHTGENPDISKEEFMRDTMSVWEIKPDSAKKRNHPAPFPEELPYRCIKLYSYPGDVVLDPYAGSGSTAVATIRTGRTFIGCDKNPDYVLLAQNRIKEHYERYYKPPFKETS